MKIENNLENKAKFMFQYYGQTIFKYSGNYATDKLYKFSLDCKAGQLHNGYLELTPLTNITDEDAIDLANKCKHDDFAGLEIRQLMIENDSYWIEYFNHYEILVVFDFLRSKGYALPYLDLSVADLISYGWVKLKSNKN